MARTLSNRVAQLEDEHKRLFNQVARVLENWDKPSLADEVQRLRRIMDELSA